jgi:hypothetical protein
LAFYVLRCCSRAFKSIEEEKVVPGVHFSEEYSHGWDDLQRGHNYSGKKKLSENMAKVIEAWLNGAIAPNANNNRLPIIGVSVMPNCLIYSLVKELMPRYALFDLVILKASY